MKKILILFSILELFLFTGCRSRTESLGFGVDSRRVDKNRVVLVEYSTKVNGYSVTAVWKPREIVSGGYILGAAIIELKNEKDSACYTLTNNSFGISTKFLVDNKIVITYSKDSSEVESQPPPTPIFWP